MMIGWLEKGVPTIDVSADKIDFIMNIDADGRRACRNSNDRVSLTVRDAVARYKDLISKKLSPIGYIYFLSVQRC